ncbi:hypothetical protein A3860_37930 [Niastella vici]|uniref:Outer membrane protein beta-barrel domain-containing protein n=1 Tax=Niastella vici TaxID=1703345 RepID=A0A1V9FM57_9BACT|nr:hypothetical protein [Niastella vici]OQP59439.1 hypothetical protein A3860_37930 [Niastella vici]
MKPLFLICSLLGWHTLAFCQTGKVTGSVMDAETKTPLELATVAIHAPDSSVIAYQLSDKYGLFSIGKLPLKKKLLVSVSYAGYISYNTFIQLDSARTDTLAVFLALQNKDTVVVTAAIPVRMNGDTLEINPAAFKMKSDAVVEELLNQVAGITIWSDGTITVNGKKVKSLLVDGKPFMGSTDSRIATQNLPKSAIDKIQLYQEYDRSKIGKENARTGRPQDSLLTMNIKLKEGSKKGYFGKTGAGYGTMDRFEGDLSLQLYNKKTSAGIGAGLNNTNKNIGNIEEMFQNNTYRNYNPNLYNVGRFGTNGINRNHSIGGVLVHNFIESENSRQNDRISINYNKSGTNAYVTDLNMENRTALDNPLFIRDDGVATSRQNKHDVGINYIKTNSYNDNFIINGTVNTNNKRSNTNHTVEVRDSANRLQSTNATTTAESRNSDYESLELNFTTSNADEPVKGFNTRMFASRDRNASTRDVISEFGSFTNSSKNTYNNRRYATNNESLNITGNLEYTGFKRMLLRRYNLFGINLSLMQWFNYTRSTENVMVSDYDSTAKRYFVNSNLSNGNKKEIIEFTPILSMSKSFDKFTGVFYRGLSLQVKLMDDLKTDKNTSSIAQRNLNRSFAFFRYEGNLDYRYTKREKYSYNASVSYAKYLEYPAIDRLYALVDDINAYDIRIGNPHLKNSINHSVSLNANFNTENPKSLYTINGNINGSYKLLLAPVTDSIINDFSGKRISWYINSDRTSALNLNYYFNVSRKLNRNSLQLMYNGELTTGKVPNYIDGISNISETGRLLNQFNLQFLFSSRLVISAGQTLEYNRSRPSAPGLNAFKNSSYTTRLGIVLNWPANITFSSTVDKITNSNIDKPVVLWNSFAAYRFMKGQGELKISAMDLLKQYQNISNNVTEYGTSTRITNGLQQYFLVTFSYYPRKFGKREIKRQSTEREW